MVVLTLRRIDSGGPRRVDPRGDQSAARGSTHRRRRIDGQPRRGSDLAFFSVFFSVPFFFAACSFFFLVRGLIGPTAD